ncbi:MAG: ABC transporter substrate-binding protein [Marinicaulis sp.]|nr:ABC transporter substrate-binding protein [Marinicaulis sp.]
MRWLIKYLAAIIFSAALISSAGAKPRAISLDYCADQYLLKLADPEQIIAVSPGADEADSYMRDEAREHRQVRPRTEEVLLLAPDVVLRQWGGGTEAESAFGRFGAEVVSIGFPTDFKGVAQSIRIAAAALEQEARGEALIEEMNARLARLREIEIDDQSALYVTPGGVTAGDQTMIHAMIEAAGLKNGAAVMGLSYWPSLSVENLVLSPPGFVVAGFFDAGAEKSNHWSAGRHPAFADMFAKTPTVNLSADILSCAAWFAVDGAEAIANAAKDFEQ